MLLNIHLGPEDGLAIGAGLGQEREYSSLRIVFMSETPGRGRGHSPQPNLEGSDPREAVRDFDALFDAIDP